jgi:hypothetical protein
MDIVDWAGADELVQLVLSVTNLSGNIQIISIMHRAPRFRTIFSSSFFLGKSPFTAIY